MNHFKKQYPLSKFCSDYDASKLMHQQKTNKFHFHIHKSLFSTKLIGTCVAFHHFGKRTNSEI